MPKRREEAVPDLMREAEAGTIYRPAEEGGLPIIATKERRRGGSTEEGDGYFFLRQFRDQGQVLGRSGRIDHAYRLMIANNSLAASVCEQC